MHIGISKKKRNFCKEMDKNDSYLYRHYNKTGFLKIRLQSSSFKTQIGSWTEPTNQPTNAISYLEALKLLSPTEIKVLDLVELGYLNQEIAELLFISVRTVQTHRNNICKKLGLKGRLGLIKWLWNTKKGNTDGM